MNKPRLIDANEVLNIIRNGWSNHYSCKDMCDEINNIPTAYDIDKVVEQLEFEKGVAFMTLGNTGDEDYDFAYDNVIQYMNTAIKIVKGGAKND